MARRRDRRGGEARADAIVADAHRRQRARTLLIGAIVAAIVGFGAGLLVRMWTDRSPEARARDAVGELQEHAREHAR
ncbi:MULTISPECIES: hypothetical protein [Anaeromyxobacter]|uniref:hypothetical protein n=1 Tax=Anaeromyxobacter TaxID=161492 RepID=UPI001F55C189|nr:MULTISPECIES: hypothetical protein [unclassified Anaeromyxobacter]